jgi:hypothetical protein
LPCQVLREEGCSFLFFALSSFTPLYTTDPWRPPLLHNSLPTTSPLINHTTLSPPRTANLGLISVHLLLPADLRFGFGLFYMFSFHKTISVFFRQLYLQTRLITAFFGHCVPLPIFVPSSDSYLLARGLHVSTLLSHVVT